MQESLVFMDALRAAVPVEPDPRLEAALVPRLAATARASTLEAETAEMRRGTVPGTRGARRPRSRLALLARVGIAVALIPLVLAGLAVAGATVPSPARSAFGSIGIDLPNQPSDHSQKPPSTKSPTGERSGNDVSNAAQEKAKGKGGNSAAAHQHARRQHEKAQGKAKGHDRGKAVGLNESTPPGQSGQTGPPPQSNAGGSSGSHAPSKAPKATHVPQGVALGQTKVPPGHSK
jgi:hypothetical protein